ncbi:hypothetical protein [Dactylosporangium sp. CA-092794]|uniref:hypothetical protein n=1 Tax=Dactylosporangium sp. CA-092794 TaxID=3239929 RepID=UPI003D8DDD85
MHATSVEEPATAPVAEPGPDLQERAPRLLALLEWSLTVAGVAVLVLFQKPMLIGDGWVRYRALDALLHNPHHLTSERYSLVGPLFSTPLWIIGWLTGDAGRGVARYNQVLFTLALVALFLLLRGRLNPTVLRRFLLVLVGATMIAPSAFNYYGEMFTCVTVGVGLLAAFDRRPGRSGRIVRFAGWVAVTLGVANTFALLPALVLVAGWQTVRTRRLRFVLPVVIAAVIALGENWLRRGGLFITGYEIETVPHNMMPYSGRAGFPYPLLLGALSILFSFGKGLVFYIPGLMLYTRRRWLARISDPKSIDLHGAYVMWYLFIAGGVCVYAKWWDWSGELFHGPRFFLVAIVPGSLALAVWISDRALGLWANVATLGVLFLASWGAAIATVFGYRQPPICIGNGYELDPLCLYTPDYSHLWYPLWSDPVITHRAELAFVYYAVVFVVLAATPVTTLLRNLRTWSALQDWTVLTPRTWRV